MKTKLGLIVLSLMTVLMLGAVSASTTIIAGKIYNSDYTATIPQADVTVTCGTDVLNTQSDNDGAYKVQFLEDTCVVDETLTVYAEKGDLSGSKTGTVKASGTCGADDNCLINVWTGVDVAVVNVPLVPEFTLVLGLTTALAALGVFFVVRRK
ncbi:MAG: hypothetical protein ACP5NZ_02225 [Nanobdellota archaeon]